MPVLGMVGISPLHMFVARCNASRGQGRAGVHRLILKELPIHVQIMNASFTL
jgi:hypothetical protein